MNRRLFSRVTPIFVILVVTLAACSAGTGGNSYSESQVQTLSAGTVEAFISQGLTQTAQAQPLYVVVTATPLPTTNLPTVTSTPQPTATNAPTKTPIPIPCNIASYVDDVTVADGTSFVAGTAFVKTWRIRNVGSCSWSSDYELYFAGGSAMSGPSSVKLSKIVKPNETIDVSVSLTAPGDPNDYTGKWMLRTTDGRTFGVGTYGDSPLTVVIKVSEVPAPKDPNTVYDFVKNYCKAEWRTNAGTISCPSSALDFKNGSITRSYAPVLENGEVDDEGAIITVPARGGDGMIRSQFPAITVHDGDRIRGTLLCSYNRPNCSVTFEVLAREKGTSTMTSLGTWSKTINDPMIHLDIDLSSMDGKNMIFYLKVSSNGDPKDDMAQWMAIRITHP